MWMGSDNLDGAEDQQERLIRLGWVTGFVDGEGCFSIGFVKQPNRAGRRGYTTGYQVTHSFVVVQGARSLDALHELRDFFDVGAVSINRRSDNHKEHLTDSSSALGTSSSRSCFRFLGRTRFAQRSRMTSRALRGALRSAPRAGT